MIDLLDININVKEVQRELDSLPNDCLLYLYVLSPLPLGVDFFEGNC